MGIYPSIPVGVLISKFDLISAHILLDFWQRKYVYCFLSLLNSIPTKTILLITLRIGDRYTQPENQLKGDGIWATH